MSGSQFLSYITGAFSFLSSIMNEFISIFNTHPWLFSFVIAPILITVIIFGINLSVSLVTKNTAGKGER